MPGLASRRRTRTSYGDLLSAPTTSAGRKSNNKVPRLEVEEDPELIEAFDDGSVLCRSLKQCGLVVRKGKTPNLLLTDQEVFLKKFKREMAILTEEELNTVKTTVEGWVEKQGQEFLKKCLQETLTSATCNTARSVLLLLISFYAQLSLSQVSEPRLFDETAAEHTRHPDPAAEVDPGTVGSHLPR